MWSKREDVKPKEHKEGSRLAIVFSGSPMFTGGAGSGESEIRRWLIPVRQLSDGERGALALVLDLTRRLAQANPGLDDPAAKGPGMVLIDEIDLHLHPKWQREIVRSLPEAFPKLQFKNRRKGVLTGILEWWKREKARLQGPVPREQLVRERARRAGDGARHLTPFDPVAVWWLDQRLARSAT